MTMRWVLLLTVSWFLRAALARQVEQGRLLEAMAHGAVEGQVTPNPQRR